MEFRPCIDIHNGKVKQIVGSSIHDPVENFVSPNDAAYYANFYRNLGISGGHVIMLNAPGHENYEATVNQALGALKAYPGGLQIGGGINEQNAREFLDAGASHVIVTSYVFKNGLIDYPNLNKLVKAVGKEKIVLDLSCRKSQNNDCYLIMTDRWQKFTDVKVNTETLEKLALFCGEFLIHAVDVEGKNQGIEAELARILGAYHGLPITYAGGIHNFTDLDKLRKLGKNRLNVTVGSALDIFGGSMKITEIIDYLNKY